MSKEIIEWVIHEVVINTNYNHVVIYSTKKYNSYEITFILYEYIYVYINHFKLPSSVFLPVVA